MSYFVNKTNGTAIVVLDGTKDTYSTSLTLLGRLSTNYGEVQNENFVRLLENFALESEPAHPITGQLWYDITNKAIKVYNQDDITWTQVGSQIVSNLTVGGNTFVGPNMFTIQDLGNVSLINRVNNGNISLHANVAGTITRVLNANGSTGLIEVLANATSNFGVTTKIYVDSLISSLTSATSTEISTIEANLAGLSNDLTSVTSNLDSLTTSITSGGGPVNAQEIQLNNNSIITNTGTGNTVVNFKTPGGVSFISATGSSPTNTGVTIRGQWSLDTGATINANYADLAEFYSSDKEYEPGTVVVFGGAAEVTVSTQEADIKVAGVVTTNPAYVMNNDLSGTRVCLALQGRTPCKVIGPVSKGDILTTSSVEGYAVPTKTPVLCSIIGKSLEDVTEAGPCIVEVAVGRI